MEDNKNLPDPSGMTYADAVAELESILSRLRSDGCNVDSLVELTGRAKLLLEACRSRLTVTEEELAAVIAPKE